jgi:hypothetical protein
VNFMCSRVDELARHPRIVDAVQDLLSPDIDMALRCPRLRG